MRRRRPTLGTSTPATARPHQGRSIHDPIMGPGGPLRDTSVAATKDAVLDLQDRLIDARSRGYLALGDLPPDLLSEIRHRLSAVLSEAASALAKDEQRPADNTIEATISNRPRWNDRDQSLKQSPRDFFLAHYPDWQSMGLTGPILKRLDPVLYARLATHGNRYPQERIRLPTRAHTAFARYAKIVEADKTLTIEDMERIVRAVRRKTRKRRL